MTQQQLEEIVAMPFGKRLMFLNAKRAALNWTEEQYAKVLRMVTRVAAEKSPPLPTPQDETPGNDTAGDGAPVVRDSGRSPAPQQVTQDEFVAALSPGAPQGATAHPDVPKGLSQKDRLLDLLSDGEWHDTVEIMAKVYKIDGEKAGNCRIPSRIDDLRRAGHNIPKAEHVKGSVYKYRLIKPLSPFYGG